MKAFLMHRNRDFDPDRALPANAKDLTQDLGLETLYEAMAGGDGLLLAVAERALLSSLTDPEAIAYRQDVLRDCLEHPAVVREIYNLAGEAIRNEREILLGIYKPSPDTILHRSLRALEMFVERLRTLREIVDEHGDGFGSEGFTTLFRTLARELDDDYLRTVDHHLRELEFPRGPLISAQLGTGSKGKGYVLREPRRRSWKERLAIIDRSSASFQIADRDEAGHRALRELRDEGVNLVANALGQSAEHILSFFTMLRTELAFYVGCLNLWDQLAANDEPTSFPEPVPAGEPALSGHGLYDVCLSLTVAERVVGNDVAADGTSLVVVTGANQGGKSTFLRSVGLAQLMAQCGMFVAAESFRTDVRSGVFTHFKREEDPTMKSGKLDEELSRMSDIVDVMTPTAMLLCNESFAATNEREGSELARRIVAGLRDAGVKVVFVTHMFDLAHEAYARDDRAALFLRAERKDDGRRTFRVTEGEPLPTSYGEDLYERIFGALPSVR